MVCLRHIKQRSNLFCVCHIFLRDAKIRTCDVDVIITTSPQAVTGSRLSFFPCCNALRFPSLLINTSIMKCFKPSHYMIFLQTRLKTFSSADDLIHFDSASSSTGPFALLIGLCDFFTWCALRSVYTRFPAAPCSSVNPVCAPEHKSEHSHAWFGCDLPALRRRSEAMSLVCLVKLHHH